MKSPTLNVAERAMIISHETKYRVPVMYKYEANILKLGTTRQDKNTVHTFILWPGS